MTLSALGEAAGADLDLAATMPTACVFPTGAQSLEVLESTVCQRQGDATAHFLLGELRMASGIVDEAIAEWRTAQRLNPAIPVLHADLGRTLLRLKRDGAGAAEALRAGLAVDPSNTELYVGLSTALAILGRPAGETVAALERFPDAGAMPVSQAYDLALSYAEAGSFDRARAVFQGRFFAREEGGTNARQVWIRVRAVKAAALAGSGNCAAALSVVDHIGEPVEKLDFTRDGLDRFITAALNQASLGAAEVQCGRSDAAAVRRRSLSTANDGATLVFAYDLARHLPCFREADWRLRLETAAKRTGGESSWNDVVRGMLELALGHPDAAKAQIESALMLPDRNLARHFGRMALRSLSNRE